MQQDEVQESIREGLQYLSAGEVQMAEEAFNAALDNAEAEFGETHAITKRCLEYSARAVMLGGKDDEMACAMYEKLLEINGDGLSASIANITMELATMYKRMGRVEDATNMESRHTKQFEAFKEKMEEDKLPPPNDGDEEDDGSEEESEEEESEDLGKGCVEEEKGEGTRWKL